MSNSPFFLEKCQTQSKKKRFGLCDDPSPLKNPAYIDEQDGAKWIAVVHNEERYEVVFTAIDNCIDLKKEDGNMEKRCDGLLIHDTTVTFVELKQRHQRGSEWVKDAEKQLKTSIAFFEKEEIAATMTTKKAYIANSEHPKFKESQINRMNNFLEQTGYLLRIENRITLD
jgi:hypothetical protein